MYNNARSVYRNGNPEGQAQARPQPIPSRQGLGHQIGYFAEVGARNSQPTRSLHDNASTDTRHRPCGGQAAGPGLFGCPSATGRPRRCDDQAKKVGGLSFGQRRARLSVAVGVPTPPRTLLPVAPLVLSVGARSHRDTALFD